MRVALANFVVFVDEQCWLTNAVCATELLIEYMVLCGMSLIIASSVAFMHAVVNALSTFTDQLQALHCIARHNT